MSTLDEKSYRKMMVEVFDRIAKAFDAIDPDIVEVELSAGACTILTPEKRSKIIVSPQPPVRQVWLAAAALGMAIHFDWDPVKKEWWDDKGKGLELYSTLRKLVLETAKVEVNI